LELIGSPSQIQKPLEANDLVARNEELLEEVKAELRRNYEFSLFCILPGVFPNLTILMQQAKKIGIDYETAENYITRLIEAGLWELKGRQVFSKFESLDLGGISVKDYLSSTISILSQLDDSKSYAYDTLSVVTNREIIRRFNHKVKSALKDLCEQSTAADAEKYCILSWSHTGVIELEDTRIGAKK
jgi:hypothetical protein